MGDGPVVLRICLTVLFIRTLPQFDRETLMLSSSPRRPFIFLFLLLLLASLACQTVTGALFPEPTLTSAPPPTLTQPPARTQPPSPTRPPLVSPTPASALPTESQLEIFQQLWDIVAENYLYPDFNGVDWNAVHETYRQRIANGLTNEDFYAAMDEMIATLGDDHSAFLSPQEAADEDTEYASNLDYVGVGIYVLAVPERERAVILVTFPGSPAEEAGIRPHDSILSADGQPILDAEGNLRDIVRGPEGTSVTLQVQTPGGEPRTLVVPRRRISGGLPVPFQVTLSPAGRRIGYLFLPTFGDGNIDDLVGQALQTMTQDGPLDGLVVDNRMNGGGASPVLEGTLSYFASGTLGHFISRNEEYPLQVTGRNVDGSQGLPLVVLVGKDTVSYGEVFAGVLQDIGRAHLIGETTDGNVETLYGYDFPDGSRAWIAHDSFRPLNHPDLDWEETGIVPEESVPAAWDEFTFETDPALQAALAYFDRLP